MLIIIYVNFPGINDNTFQDTVCDWLDSDSDLENDNEPDDEVYPTATTRWIETTTDDDLTLPTSSKFYKQKTGQMIGQYKIFYLMTVLHLTGLRTNLLLKPNGRLLLEFRDLRLT